MIRTALVSTLALLLYMPAAKALDTERYIANAVALGTPGPTGQATVEIAIERWSPDALRDRLLTTLFEKGPDKLLDELRKAPRVGYIRTPNSIGYDLHYARKIEGEDGAYRIILATDRYISAFEAINRPRSVDYPFTLIELRMRPDGQGEGKMSIAAKITGDSDTKEVVLEDYQSQPVMLTSVRREK